jgi:hypothetical protein
VSEFLGLWLVTFVLTLLYLLLINRFVPRRFAGVVLAAAIGATMLIAVIFAVGTAGP